MVEQHYRKKLLEDVFLLRRKNTFCDVTVRVGESEFGAHRVILAASSPFFQGLFASQMNENISGEVELKEISASVFGDVLQFIYTGEIGVTPQNVKELMMAANFLLIDALKEICSAFLRLSLDICNCFSLKGFAKQYNCKSLEDSANEFICAYFVEISKTEEFLSLDLEAVAEVISHDNLQVIKEEEVYEALIRWIKHDYDARKGCFEKLFQCIRCGYMCKNYLVKHVQQEPLVSESLACTQTLLKAMSAIALSDFSLLNQTNRHPLFTDVIVCCGGFHAEKRSRDNRTFCYVPSQNKWSNLEDMNYERRRNTVAVCNDTLFAFGSHGRDSKKCEAYNGRLGSWTKVANSPCNIKDAAAVTLFGQIYVLGGNNPSEDTVLCYKPASNSWSQVASMNTERGCLCAVAHDGFVFAFGGKDRNKHILNSAEKYDPDLDSWVNIASMNEKRVAASAAVLKGKPFVVGGTNGRTNLNSNEVYDADTDEWAIITFRLSPHQAAGIATMQNKSYLIGGHLYNNECVDSVVCYDEEYSWTEIDGKIPFGKQSYICCGALRIANKFIELG